MNAETKKIFRIVEVPLGATAEEAEAIINKPCEEGYYQAHFLPAEGMAFRALYKLRQKPEKGR
jgi:hypothetical protein